MRVKTSGGEAVDKADVWKVIGGRAEGPGQDGDCELVVS